MPKVNKDENSQLNLSLPCLDKAPANVYVNSPKSLESLDWGFLSYKCSKDALKGRFEVMRPKIAYLIEQGVIDPEKNGVYLKNEYINTELVDILTITNLKNSSIVGNLIVNMNLPVIEKGYHCKDRLGNPLYSPQTIVTTEKNYYKFGVWSELKDALALDSNLVAELQQAFESTDVIRFRESDKQRSELFLL